MKRVLHLTLKDTVSGELSSGQITVDFDELTPDIRRDEALNSIQKMFEDLGHKAWLTGFSVSHCWQSALRPGIAEGHPPSNPKEAA